MGTANRTVKKHRCIGDPYGGDCIAIATGFVFGAIPQPEHDENGEPCMFVALPVCDGHGAIAFEWVDRQSPLEVTAWKIEVLEPLCQRMIEVEGQDVFLYQRESA